MNHSWFWRVLAIGVPVLNCGSIMPDPGFAWPGSTPRPSKPTTSVSEAEVRLHRRVLAGGGPEGCRRSGNHRTRPHPHRAEFPALPERCESVLCHTAVEGLDPHEVAPIFGLTANGVAALSYRARMGLRKVWLQAQVSVATVLRESQWAIARLGDFARDGLTSRERTRVSDHLATCARCSIISEEKDEVGSHRAHVLLPLVPLLPLFLGGIAGGIAGGGLLASLSLPTSAIAVTIAPALPPAFAASVVATPTVVAA